MNEHETDPHDADSDDDGLLDGEEVDQYETDPNDSDTDDGGVTDGKEVENGTDPLDGSDDFDTPGEDTGVGGIPDDTGLATGMYKGGGGCGCTTTEPAAGAGLVALLAGLLLIRR